MHPPQDWFNRWHKKKQIECFCICSHIMCYSILFLFTFYCHFLLLVALVKWTYWVWKPSMGSAGKQEELRTVSTSILRSKKEEIWRWRKYLANAEKHKLFFLKSENVKKAPSNPKSWEQSTHLFPEKGNWRYFWGFILNKTTCVVVEDELSLITNDKIIFSMELKKFKMEERKLL